MNNDARPNASEQHELRQSGSSLDQMNDQTDLGVEKPAQPSLSTFPSKPIGKKLRRLILRGM